MSRERSERSDAVAQAIKVLNEAVALEPEAITRLMFHRVRIGKELADHPTIQCRSSGPDIYEVSALGLINGLFGVDEDDWGFIRILHVPVPDSASSR